MAEALHSGHRRGLPESIAESLLAQLTKEFLRLLPIRWREHREMSGFQIQLDSASVGNFLAATDGVRMIREQPIHLLGGTDIARIAAVTEPIFVRAKLTRVDA